MFEAIIREIRATPLAALGAIAGVLSFVFSWWGLADAPSDLPVQSAASRPNEKPLTFVQLSLLVPTIAFTLSYISMIARRLGEVSGIAASVIFFFVSAVLSAAFSGAFLGQFGVQRITSGAITHEYVVGVHLTPLSFALMAVSLVTFAGSVSQELVADWRRDIREYKNYATIRKSANSEKELLGAKSQMEMLDQKWNYWKGFWGVTLAFCILLGWLVSHVILRASL